MAVNKVVMNTANGEETLIDLTGDTVTADTLAEGVTAHDASGARIVGTFPASEIQAQLDILNADIVEIKTYYATKQEVSIDYVTKLSMSTVLADYAKKEDVESTYAKITALSNYATMQSVSTALANYATKSYVDTAVAGAGQDIYQHNIRFYYSKSGGEAYDIVTTVYTKSSTAFTASTFATWLLKATALVGGYLPATGAFKTSAGNFYHVYKMYCGDTEEINVYFANLSGSSINTTWYISVYDTSFKDAVVKMT